MLSGFIAFFEGIILHTGITPAKYQDRSKDDLLYLVFTLFCCFQSFITMCVFYMRKHTKIMPQQVQL